MSNLKRFLLFILLPALAPMIFPPATMLKGPVFLLLVAVLFAALGFLVWQGRSLALTLLIFLQGMNVIIRLMMFFPNTVNAAGQVNLTYMVASLISMGLSMYLLLRLDQTDVRVQMVT